MHWKIELAGSSLPLQASDCQRNSDQQDDIDTVRSRNGTQAISINRHFLRSPVLANSCKGAKKLSYCLLGCQASRQMPQHLQATF